MYEPFDMLKLRKLVIESQLSSRELAEKSGLSYSWISQFARGDITNPTVDSVLALKKALECG